MCNGAYGKRMMKICDAIGIPYDEVTGPEDWPVSKTEARKKLEANTYRYSNISFKTKGKCQQIANFDQPGCYCPLRDELGSPERCRVSRQANPETPAERIDFRRRHVEFWRDSV